MKCNLVHLQTEVLALYLSISIYRDLTLPRMQILSHCLLQPDDGHYVTDLNVCTRLTLKISYKYVVTSSR